MGRQRGTPAAHADTDSARSGTADDTPRPHAVNIIAFRRIKRWATYQTAEAADAEIAKLRKIGFHAERGPA